ncbi:7968_t:CDS:2, partial [Diversispora eburnea]
METKELKYLLQMFSLVEIPQEISTEVEDNTVINTLVTDYSRQEYNFIMKSNISRDVLASRNFAHTKLLITYQNIENLEKKSKNRLHDVKRVQIDESLDKDLVSPEYLNSKFRTEESNELVGYNTEEGGSTKVDKNGKKILHNK